MHRRQEPDRSRSRMGADGAWLEIDNDDYGDRPRIAVVETSVSVATVLNLLLQEEGYPVSTLVITPADMPDQAVSFLGDCKADVCLYNIAYPCTPNWARFLRVRRQQPGCAFIVMTTAPRAVGDLIGEAADVILVELPFQTDQLMHAVRSVAHRAKHR